MQFLTFNFCSITACISCNKKREEALFKCLCNDVYIVKEIGTQIFGVRNVNNKVCSTHIQTQYDTVWIIKHSIVNDAAKCTFLYYILVYGRNTNEMSIPKNCHKTLFD